MKTDTEPEGEPLVLTRTIEPAGSHKTGEQGNTSMDTGVSSDLSESRPSLVGEEDEEEEESQGEEEESGGEFYQSDRHLRQRRHHPIGRSDEDSESNESGSGHREESRRLRHKTRRTMRQRRDQGRKRQRPTDELIDEDDDDHRRGGDDAGGGVGDDLRRHLIQAKQKKRITIRQDTVASSSVDFSCRTHLIHPATLARPVASATLPATDSKDSMPSTVNTKSSIMDVESSGSAAAAAAAAPRLLSSFINLPVTTSSGRHVNNLFQHDEMLTNPPEEYNNEEDDPFSAVLREMKLKGEFPCRLCEAVFPNLRALKGKTITTKFVSSFYF